MGGSSGGGIPGLSPAEQQQMALQNQLLDLQIQDEMRKRADDAYKSSPTYLNQQADERSAQGQRDYTTAKTQALLAGQNNIKNAFMELGQPDLAAPYLAALQADANNMKYTVGARAGTSSTPYDESNWNEAAYLAANPDVAASVSRARASGQGFMSGLEHYQTHGKAEGRALSVPNTSIGADTWDDPSSLATKDYIGDAINNIRLGRKDTAFSDASTRAKNQLTAMGLDQDTYGLLGGRLDTALNNAYSNAGLSSNDYTGVFDPNAILNSVLDTQRLANRGGYVTQARSAFSGYDPLTAFDDTSDDSYINDIVSRQYGDAASALERARARGALTDTGFNAGLNYLGEQKGTALSNAQTLGGSVLTRNRDTLSGIQSKASYDAGNWDFGQSAFDANKYLDQYKSKQSELQGSLGNDISNALAGQNWFNVGDVLTKAGYAQGAQNTKSLASGYDTPALSALASERDKRAASGRGLGGAGVF